MNISEDDLKQYIAQFHETLEATAGEFLPTQYYRSLLHASLLPARVIGYVSTQFGAGIEYVPATQTEIQIVRGSSRVEDLFVRAPSSLRDIGPMIEFRGEVSNFHKTHSVRRISLSGGFPFRLSGSNSGCIFEEVAFGNGSWYRHVTYAAIFSNRTVEFWSKAQAIARAKDEVLAALSQIKRAEERKLSLPAYIAKFKEKTVLVLGDYDDAGTKRLQTMTTILSARGYDPILIKDFPDIPFQDLPQKVATIGSLARFVLVDDSTKSGHLVEVQLCRTNNWITVLLRRGGHGASWMTAGASVTSNLILEKDYEEPNLDEAIDDVVQWVEAKIIEFQCKFDTLFPWRIPS